MAKEMNTQIDIEIKLNVGTLEEADRMMKKMLQSLNFEELDVIKEAKITKTLYEVEVNNNVFRDENES